MRLGIKNQVNLFFSSRAFSYICVVAKMRTIIHNTINTKNQ